LFVPHTHDPHDSIDDWPRGQRSGHSCGKDQPARAGGNGRCAADCDDHQWTVDPLADIIHNLAHALTPSRSELRFALSRHTATRRYNYGYGRVEDLAGVFIVIKITLSALLAGYDSIRRFLQPQPVANLLWYSPV